MSEPVRAFHPNGPAEKSAQGQDQVPIFWGGPDGNMPDSETSCVRILMPPRKVSRPHVHRTTQVQVSLESGWFGVFTLWGDRLEHETLVRPGGVLVIRPGIPHVALYPGRRPDNGDRIVVDAVATEFRNTPDYRHDVVYLPELWAVAYRRMDRLGMAHLFDFPPRDEWK